MQQNLNVFLYILVAFLVIGCSHLSTNNQKQSLSTQQTSDLTDPILWQNVLKKA